MPRLALKPDSSFFRKIALGAFGARAIADDLSTLNHDMRELERGSLDTKLWTEVKRKRVRVPDLVCLRCGMRVESRAKGDASLAMSHSTVAERAWDFGMVDADVVAFPVCGSSERLWTAGRLSSSASYWHERNWVQWSSVGTINYFAVQAFRATPPTSTATKGVTEGSETMIEWRGTFASQPAVIESVDGRKITVRFDQSGRRHTRSVGGTVPILVQPGEHIDVNSLIASAVAPLSRDAMSCSGHFPEADHIRRLLGSRERTQRFTGIKLARLLSDASHADQARSLLDDPEEDIYIRLEAAAYLVGVIDHAATNVFDSFLASADQQTQLEAVIALGETGTESSVAALAAILHNVGKAYFLRSAAAFCLGHLRYADAAEHLISAFGDVDQRVREESLQAVVGMGDFVIERLAARLTDGGDRASGAAEALRQLQASMPQALVEQIAAALRSTPESIWQVWLLGQLSRDRLGGAIAEIQRRAPEAHYALTVLWSFTASWIARHWELNPTPTFPAPLEADEV